MLLSYIREYNFKSFKEFINVPQIKAEVLNPEPIANSFEVRLRRDCSYYSNLILQSKEKFFSSLALRIHNSLGVVEIFLNYFFPCRFFKTGKMIYQLLLDS